MNAPIYLDYNATTPVATEEIETAAMALSEGVTNLLGRRR